MIKTRFARCRINPVHPELVTPRFKLIEAEVGQLYRRQREIREAEQRGRERR